jgi:Undecaprenyl-phosphate galactose phosphotransferase WbaP
LARKSLSLTRFEQGRANATSQMRVESDTSSIPFIVDTPAVPRTVSVNRPVGTLACLMAADVLGFTISLAIGAALRDLMVSTPARPIGGTLLPALLVTLATFTVAGLYPGVGMNPVEELRRCSLSLALSFAAIWSATFFLHDLSSSRLVYGLAFLSSATFIPVFRALVRRMFCRRAWWGSQVAILGLGESGNLLLRTLIDNPQIGLKPFAVLDDDSSRYLDVDQKFIRGPLSRCLEITVEHQISYGIFCMPSLPRDEMLRLLDLYGSCFSHVLVIPNLIGMTSLGICARELGGIVGLEVTRQLLRPSSRFIKRSLDLAIALLIAPLVAVILAFFALLIRLDSPGPVFYANERVGLGGKKFKVWKLRSMKTNSDEILALHLAENPSEAAEWQTKQKLKRDPRITRVGAVIRKTSIDELPQLWNVIVGQMSLVGPRPLLEHQIPLYGPGFSLYKQVRPGITGLWQVSGRNELAFNERVKLDKYVVQNWSVWLDLYILARTMAVVLTAKGAY